MFSVEEKAHYQRHFQLPEVGQAGQEKLKKSSVLCVGVGGLSSPVLLYLAAAGVGKIGLIDADIVDASNLQRQIIHGYNTLSQSKVESAKARLIDLNPWIEIEAHQCFFSTDNALELAKGYDLIIDGSDNFETRYLTNDVAFRLKIPNVYASIFRFEGQVSVFASHLGGPCYRCMLPVAPAAELAPT
ncbi:ThiF family adenylyltransferase [Akkermansiaceae bacterium]|nr:ThiF family adenylyltransferase [Akkermansiaceae bacterium]